MARPKKLINQKQFESLCSIQCTEEEICDVLDVTPKTLQAWCRTTYKKGFSQVFKEKRSLGKASLRRSQWKMAETNPTMAIWLGKQHLGQRDNRDIVLKQTIEQETIDEVESFLDADDEPTESPEEA